MSEAVNTLTTVSGADQTLEQEGNAAGQRARRVLMLKNLIPADLTVDGKHVSWITHNVVAKGKGTHVLLGRIFGLAMASQRRMNDINGKPTPSIAITGRFECESMITGEVSQASTVYLPMAYAEQLEAALADKAVTGVQVDIDIGIEATGKAIPYEWTVIAHLPLEDSDVMKSMRMSRRPGKAPNRPVLIEGNKVTALPSPEALIGHAQPASAKTSKA